MLLARIFSKPFFLALLLWFLAGSALYLLADLFFMPYLAGRFKGTVDVPALAGLPPERAKDILEGNGLIFMLDSSGDYSTDVVAGKILSQYPLGGTAVKQGRRIWVKISKGFKSVELPALRGLSLRQAEITLEQAGLQIGKVTNIRHGGIPAGAVIGTSPPANAVVEKGRLVNVQVSEGGGSSAPETMPSLSGLSLERAKDRIGNLGLKLGKIEYRKDMRKLPHSVLSQVPAAGAALRGQAVDLVISK